MTFLHRLLLALATALLAGCASFAPYNPVLEQRVLRMNERAHELVAASRRRPIPLAESQSFLRDSLSTLQWMHEDTVRYGSKGPSIEAAERLREQFIALQAAKRPLNRTDLLGAIGSTAELRAIQSQHRAAHEWREAHPASTTSSTDTDTTTTTDDQKKCDKDHKHDHCDDGHGHKHH